MKIKGINPYISVACVLFISSTTTLYGGTMGPIAPLDTIYIGAFGGGGGFSSGNIFQAGTAFQPIEDGGPLAVNAIGSSKGNSFWVVGGHVGHLFSSHLFNSSWTAAGELEGYYIGGATLEGDHLINESLSLDEHDFHVNYPLHTGVFLVNAILGSKNSTLGRFHPYLGIGAGGAVISISRATSTQLAPPEIGVNHYNASSSDTQIAFAAQPKIGVSFDLTPNTEMFVEYRFLYLSATDFTFGSTVYPTHNTTTAWDVKLGSQYYNMGTVGIHFDV